MSTSCEIGSQLITEIISDFIVLL